MANKTITVSAAIREAIAEEMRKDKDIFMMGEDIGKFGGCFGITAGLYDEFPDRIFDTPISEGAVANMAIGASLYGKRPIFELMFADFVSYAYAPICMEMASYHYVSGGRANMPLVVRAPQGGFINSGCQHSNCVEGWVQNSPGLTVIAPTTPKDMKGLLKASIRSANPILFLEHKLQLANKGEVPEEDYVIPIGKADVVKEGKDVTIVAWQLMRAFTEKAMAELEKEGISVELIDPRTIKPIDYETINSSVKKTGRLLVVHEHVKAGGVGESIAANVTEAAWDALKKPVQVLGRANCPIPAGLEEAMIYPSAETIADAVRDLVK